MNDSKIWVEIQLTGQGALLYTDYEPCEWEIHPGFLVFKLMIEPSPKLASIVTIDTDDVLKLSYMSDFSRLFEIAWCEPNSGLGQLLKGYYHTRLPDIRKLTPRPLRGLMGWFFFTFQTELESSIQVTKCECLNRNWTVSGGCHLDGSQECHDNR